MTKIKKIDVLGLSLELFDTYAPCLKARIAGFVKEGYALILKFIVNIRRW